MPDKILSLGKGERENEMVIRYSNFQSPEWSSLISIIDDDRSRGVRKGEISVSLSYFSRHYSSIKSKLRAIRKNDGATIERDEAIGAFLNQLNQNDIAKDNPRPEMSAQDIEEKLAQNGFLRTLKKYQLHNVQRMARRKYAADFSVPGAGKTTEALALFTLLKESAAEKLLVVCPKNVLSSWVSEIEGYESSEGWVPGCFAKGHFKMTIVNSESIKYPHDIYASDIWLTNYEFFGRERNDSAMFETLNNSPENISVFLDESHRIKGLDGVRAQSIHEITCSRKVSNRLIMSGTPCPQSSGDLISQFQFLCPGTPLEETESISRLTNIFVRTTKSNLGLPPISGPDDPAESYAPMKKAHSQLYHLIKEGCAKQLNNYVRLNRRDRNKVRKIQKAVLLLLQVAVHPQLVMTNKNVLDVFDIEDEKLQGLLYEVKSEGIPSKIERAVEIAKQNAREGKKTVIWSSFVKTVEYIAEILSPYGSQFIHGGVEATGNHEDEGSREAKIRDFQTNKNTYILVANPSSCSEGISLHRQCHHAVYVDRTFNATHFLQSRDRIHRIGVPDDVKTIIQVLESDATIDISVNERLEDKITNMGIVLNDKDLIPKYFLNDNFEDMESYQSNSSNLFSDQDIEAVLDKVR